MKDNEKDEMEQLLLKWQDPDDEGLLVSEQDLHTWTLPELQTMCTIARDLTTLYTNGFSHVSRGSYLVERPDKKAIKDIKESDERVRRAHANKEKEKGNDIGDKKEEKSQFIFEERNDEMNFNNDINVSSKGFGEITGQSGKFGNIKTCTAPDGKKWYFMYNIAGKLISKCEKRPDGYDSDDIDDENNWEDLIQRPFFHLWTNEADQDGERVYRKRVPILYFSKNFLYYFVAILLLLLSVVEL